MTTKSDESVCGLKVLQLEQQRQHQKKITCVKIINETRRKSLFFFLFQGNELELAKMADRANGGRISHVFGSKIFLFGCLHWHVER